MLGPLGEGWVRRGVWREREDVWVLEESMDGVWEMRAKAGEGGREKEGGGGVGESAWRIAGAEGKDQLQPDFVLMVTCMIPPNLFSLPPCPHILVVSCHLRRTVHLIYSSPQSTSFLPLSSFLSLLFATVQASCLSRLSLVLRHRTSICSSLQSRSPLHLSSLRSSVAVSQSALCHSPDFLVFSPLSGPLSSLLNLLFTAAQIYLPSPGSSVIESLLNLLFAIVQISIFSSYSSLLSSVFASQSTLHCSPDHLFLYSLSQILCHHFSCSAYSSP
ncbi:hypothetical protein BaRGS_00013840 [Batillaria attramentaria]|uniref:Uncharacterized protein n=1 Tax=Batillaria attramentaria TaxID=370345 RepID=A0ABD0L6T1_9CAEN